MRKSSLACALLVGLSLGSGAALSAPLDQSTTIQAQQERAAVIKSIAKRWQLSAQAEARLATLSDSRLELADRATSQQDLDLLFMEAPFSRGISMGALMMDRPGNLTMVGSGATAKGVAKFNPGTNPTLYDDLVFTAVNPCRVYDSRFSTAPVNGTPGATWPANTVRTIDFGPQASYAFQGGQAAACMGSLVGLGEIASVVASVSTVSQTGQGYLVFFASGAANPAPYGVAQYFQPGYVQTSFIIVPTDLISNVFTNGVAGQAGTHVIVDVVGYFAQPKAVALECTDVDISPATATWANGTTASVNPPACAAGYTRASLSCGYNGSLPVNAYLTETGAFGYCEWRNNTGIALDYQFLRVRSRCCRVPGR